MESVESGEETIVLPPVTITPRSLSFEDMIDVVCSKYILSLF